MTPALAIQATKAITATSKAVPQQELQNVLCHHSRSRLTKLQSATRCGRNGDDRVPRTAKEPEDESTKQTRIKSGFGRQVGERCVTQTAGSRYAASVNASENMLRSQRGLRHATSEAESNV